MLKFLEKQINNENQRTPIKYHPQKTYGNSFESPSQFQMRFNIIDDQSYLNPFLKYDDHAGIGASGCHSRSVDTRWTKKINLSHLESSKLQIGKDNQGKVPHMISGYQARYHQEITDNPLRFHLVKGEFSQYINKNNHYQSIGPLQGIERTPQRIQVTKSTLRQKQASKIQQLTTSNKFSGQLYNTIKSNLIKNSSLLTQRVRIKRNREFIHSNFKKELENRKKKTNYTFTLPQMESNSQNLRKQPSANNSIYHRRYKTEIQQT